MGNHVTSPLSTIGFNDVIIKVTPLKKERKIVHGMYRLELRRRLCVPAINYNEERKELNHKMLLAALLKAVSRPTKQDYSKLVSTLPVPVSRPGGSNNKVNIKLQGKMQVAALLTEASRPAQEEYSKLVSTLPKPKGNDNLINLHRQLRRVTLLKVAWQLVEKALPRPELIPASTSPQKSYEEYGTMKRKLLEEDVGVEWKHRRVVNDSGRAKKRRQIKIEEDSDEPSVKRKRLTVKISDRENSH